MKRNSLYIQYGAGQCCPDDWLNYDATPTLRLQKIPLLGKLIVPRTQRFPRNLIWGDIVQGLPVPAASADGVYASHVLEHLALEEFRIALRNTLTMLKPGGIFRLIVPDLAERARRYIQNLNVGKSDACILFMRSCSLGKDTRNKSIEGIFRDIFGNSAHLCMWDEPAIKRELTEVGFEEIRRCEFGDSTDKMFGKVEEQSRFVDAGYQPALVELAIEAKRPIVTSRPPD